MPNMATSAPIAAYPKRKRAQVSYAEPGEEDELVSEFDMSGDDEYSPNKKLKKHEARASTRSKAKAKNDKSLHSKRQKKDEKPFPFLSLPAELRDVIYEMALTDENGIILISKTRAYRRRVERDSAADIKNSGLYNRRRRRRLNQSSSQETAEPAANSLSPNVLAVNKQIHFEATSVLYKQALIFDDTMALHHFLGQIGQTNRMLLDDISIKEWGFGRGTHKAMNFAALTMLAGANNLKALRYDCEFGWNRKPVDLARQIFRDGHVFLDAYATANGKHAAIDVVKPGEVNFDWANSWDRPTTNTPDPAVSRKAFQTEMMRLLS